MKGIVKLGFKNLLRYKRRTIITAIAVAMGLMMFIMMDSMLQGANQDSEINIQRFETASGKVVSSEYWKDFKEMPIKETISPELLERFEATSLAWAPRIDFAADLIFKKGPNSYPEDGTIPSVISAIDPTRDQEVFYLQDHIAEGRFLESDEYGVLVGSWLAEDMGIQLGFPLDILVRSRFGGQELMELEVVGIVETPNPVINRSGVYIPLAIADDYLEMDGLVTQIALSLKGPSDQQKLQDLLQGSGSEFHPWQDWSADFLAIVEGKQTSSSSILFLVFIIAAVGISNTVLMSIFERVRELGMMRALGMTDRDVRLLFLTESSGIGLLGGILGTISGALMNLLLVKKGIDYSALLRDVDVGYRISNILYGVWNPLVMIIALFSGILICALISWLSTRKLNRMPIIACLRYQ